MSATLAEQADDNLAAHFSWVHPRTRGMFASIEPDLVVVDSGLPTDTFNSVCRARLDDRVADVRVAETIARFREAGRPFSWWTSPADRPTTLTRILAARGLEPVESEVAMALDLARLEAGEPPAGLEVARIRTAADLAELARICAGNWTPPDQGVLDFYRLGAAALLQPDCPLHFYLGRFEGRPVATAELAAGGGVVGLYNICTIPALRGRGIGTWISTRPLLDARLNGYRTAILQAAPDGLGIYRRLGFEAYGDCVEYK